ncbi:MAG TPA: AAA family ATPase [Candidatus Saccharimonadales bacterium]|nr:AAA family ATPase [Candidatus Saccharimonadales bacterium]
MMIISTLLDEFGMYPEGLRKGKGLFGIITDMKTPTDVHGAYLVTGPSGVGKTTVARELQRLGFNVEYNAGVCHFVDSTGKEAPRPWEVSNLAWLSMHRWVFNDSKLADILQEHKNNHIFIEAIAANMDGYQSHFKNIFYLKLDDDALAERIMADSRANRYGKEDFQLLEVIDGAKNLELWVKAAGGSIIDASQPIDKIIETVLAATE